MPCGPEAETAFSATGTVTVFDLNHVLGPDGRYVATIELGDNVEPDEIVARVLPSNVHTDGEAMPGLITWSR